jgi:hypothetical protein
MVGNPEVMALIASFEDYFRVARNPPTIGPPPPIGAWFLAAIGFQRMTD